MVSSFNSLLQQHPSYLMATIAEFTVPSEAFPLGSLFEDIPQASMELDRIVPTRNTFIPYVWVHDGDADTIRASVHDHQDLSRMTVVDEADNVVLYRIEWDTEARGILTCIVETDVSLLSGTGTKGEWVFEIRADSQDCISNFQQCCKGHDIPLTLSRLHSLTEMDTRGRYNLTPQQQESLVLAFKEGYFEEPSEANLDELAEQLGITRQSLSSRLKRGYRNLIGSTLIHEAK